MILWAVTAMVSYVLWQGAWQWRGEAGACLGSGALGSPSTPLPKHLVGMERNTQPELLSLHAKQQIYLKFPLNQTRLEEQGRINTCVNLYNTLKFL